MMFQKKLRSLLGVAVLLCAAVAALAQKKTKATPPTTVALAPAVPTFNAATFKALKWRNIGPFRGGRSNAVAGHPTNDNLYYVGYTGGGVWKTEDAGLNWRNISDGQFKSGSVGDIAVAAADPNVIYVGMGEHAVRGVMTTYGDGVYRSNDGGNTWKHLGLEKTRHISDVIVHPADPETVWVAAQGALHGPSADRGVYKSTDGGKTWKRTLFIDDNTGVSSLSMDVQNPRILYAATWEHRRLPWKVVSGGAGSGVWKSMDGGETWTKINEGLPKEMGKIGVSVSPVNPNRVFAIVEAERTKAGLYRSDDGGKRWNHLCSDQNITSRSWYYMEVFADPANQDVVYVLNAPMTKSIDGGKTFSTIRVGHGDTHDLWINPSNNQNMILGDDGGGEITFNGGRSWSSLNNQPTAQFYRVNVDHLFPYRVYGGQQDNSSVVIASRTNGPGITTSDWFRGPGCESAYIAFDPKNPQQMLGGCYQGLIELLDTRTMEGKDVMQYAALNLANPPREMKYRFNWNAPIVASPHDPSTIYHAGNVLFKTTDGGLTWAKISPDLTRNDPAKQDLGGGPITNEGAGGENYNTINYVIESSLEKGLLYTGSDCGLVFVSRNGGQDWANVTPSGLEECLIQSIEVSPHTPGTAYVCATRYKFNDMGSYTYRTSDYGRTWTKISTGIAAEDFLKVIREDKKVKGLLYGGGERGFYLSYDAGNSWVPFQLNLPVVPVTDLIIHDNDLIAATAGRAFWIFDDLAPMQQMAPGQADQVVKLLSPKPTVRFSSASYPGAENMGLGANPMNGVILDYFLPEKADTNLLVLEVVNANGKVIRTYTNKKNEAFKPYPGGPAPASLLPAEAGLNRFAWDLRTEGPTDVPGVFIYGDYSGHRVAPGQYTVRLKHKGQMSETTVNLLPDPRLAVAAADWVAQQNLLEKLHQQINDMHQAVNALRKVKKQIEAFNEAFKEVPDGKEMVTMGKDLLKKIDAWEANIVEARSKNGQDIINWPSKLSAEYFTLREKVDVADPRITQGVRDRLVDLEAEWQRHQKSLQSLMEGDIQQYNQQFRSKNLPVLVTGAPR